MPNWWTKKAPRRASVQLEDLVARIEDDGKRITVSLEHGHVPFILYLTREPRPDAPGHYLVQDLMGNGFATPKWFGRGAGTFLCNLVILYLQALDEVAFPEVRGTPHHTTADPAGHAQVREAFFRRFGAKWDGAELRASVSSLQAQWRPLPFGRSQATVEVGLGRFTEEP